MVSCCCFKECEKAGLHRVKKIVNKNNPIFERHEVPRVCEVHYFYILKCVEVNIDPDFNIKDNPPSSIDENEEFVDVEYLEEYTDLRRKTNKRHRDLLCIFFLLFVLCLTILYNKLQLCQHQTERIKTLERENRMLKLSLKSQEIKHQRQKCNYLKGFRKIFNEDQIDVIVNQLKRPRKWCDNTILRSLKTKFACRQHGYLHLRTDGYPLPSIRSLQQKMEGLNFEPGILDDVFLFMEQKVKSFNRQERECQLVIDEMSIIEGTQYDIGNQSFVGDITIPQARSKVEGAASNLLVFMLRGLSSNYKQIVAFEFTGKSMNAEILRDIIIKIVKKAWHIGLRVNGLTNDMGGSNIAVWRLWGIKAQRNGKEIKNWIPHPCDPSRKFWIISDVPHLLKRVVQGILNNKKVVFDKCIVDQYSLDSNTVNCEDIFELYNIQKDDVLKMAPRLKSHILSPNTFQKMNVPVSTNLISSNVSTALFFLHSELSQTEKANSTYETTAWFSQVLTRWFKVMSSRHFTMCITKSNYDDVESELQEVLNILRNARFGSDGKWKPFQRGMIVVTTSILEMSKYLLDQGFDYVLPGRLTQDCLENLFSTVRFGNPKPNALQCRDAIKSICISEYLNKPRVNKTSYEWDDSTYLTDFLATVRKIKEEHKKENHDTLVVNQAELNNQFFDIDVSDVFLNKREKNVLYKIACHILYKISKAKKRSHCVICLSSCRSNSSNRCNKDKKYALLMNQPNLVYNSTLSVFHINDDLYEYFVHMEKMFRKLLPIVSANNKHNLGLLITNKIMDRCIDCSISSCHSLKKTITSRFVAFKLKNSGQQRERNRKFTYSSHSMN